ncbi:MAG: InlB B-repeat-containing protein [Lachnospiraceae bacterium]|nr:InlB B-repeat-containing protein [Lachnospiraceae bacterium]
MRQKRKTIRRKNTQLLSLLLTLIMIVELIPVTSITALAAGAGISDAVVASYAEVAADGDEQRAREELDALYEAGIIDENGNMVELDLREDGESVDLSDLTRRIAEGESVGDLSVNGYDSTPEQVTQIQQVNSMLEVVRLLDQDIEVTDEHVDNLESLLTGITDGSIDMDEVIEDGMLSMSMTDEDETLYTDSVEPLYDGGSGSDATSGTVDVSDGKYTQPYIDGSTYEASHAFALTDANNTSWYSDDGTDGIGLDGTITLSCADTATPGGTVTVTATLDKAQRVPVSFDWTAAAGSIGVTGTTSGTITWDANDKEDKSFTVTVAEKGDELWQGDRSFSILVGNLKNASLDGENTAWNHTVKVSANDGDAIKEEAYVWGNEVMYTSFTDPGGYDASTFKWLYVKHSFKGDRAKLTFNHTLRTTADGYNAESYYSLSTDNWEDCTRGKGKRLECYNTYQCGQKEYTSTVERELNGEQYINFGMKSYYPNDVKNCKLTSIKVEERVPPQSASIQSISVPEGTYYPGEIVPITITTNTYVSATSSTKLTVNGTQCDALESGESQKLTFGYTVPAVNPGQISVTGISGLVNGTLNDINVTGDFPQTVFGSTQGVALLSDIKKSQLDFENVKYGISDGDPGAQVVTVVVPFKSGLTDTDKAWVTNEAVQINADSFSIDLPVPDCSNGTATHYLAGAYFSCDGGKTRYPIYVVNSGSEGVALAARFAPPTNESADLRNDTLNLFMDSQVVNSNDDATQYLPAYSDMKTDESGFSYSDVSGKDAAPALIGVSYSYYVKGGVFFEKKEYGTEENPTYTARAASGDGAAAADQTGIMEGFLKRTDGKYIVLQDKVNPGNQYDVEIVVGQDFYDAMNDSMRAESPKSMTLSYQCSDRKNFTFVKPKDFEWICYKIVENDDKTELVEDETSFEFILDEHTPANGTTPGIWHVIPTGLGDGRFCFALKVKNGTESKSYKLHMVQDEDGNVVFGAPITVVMGKTPFLTIPEYSKVRTTLSGENTDILFASNVAARNTYAGKSTTFTAKLYEAEEDNSDGSDGYKKKNDTVLKTGSVTSDGEEQINRYTIPDDWINSAGIYAVELGTKYEGGSQQGDMGDVTGGETEEKTLTAIAYLVVKQAPAKIKLAPLDSYSVTSDKTNPLALDFTISSGTSQTEVEYTIQKSGETVSERKGSSDESLSYTTGASDGSISFTAEKPQNLKEAYAITVYARNKAKDPWSVDSMLLTVYNKDLLDILVKDVVAGEIGGTTGGTGDGARGATIAMDNHDKVENYNKENGKNYQLSFDDFTTLRTDMSLQKIISANYGAGVWGMLSDKMQWASSDPATVSVDYKQGGLYSDIRNYSYVSYAPATDFLLVGKDDTAEGESVTITATHANTGMSADIKVTTKTLTDQLYVFQFQPRTTTTVTYKNGNGETRNLTSNANGELAVYEPAGIDSAIMASSTVGSDTYVGTLYKSELVSGERDIAALQLYPCNNLRLRAIANAALNILDSDGQPYSGSVTVRAGVYKNGTYCPGAEVKTVKGSAGNDGKQDISVTATDGKLNLWFDPRQFNISNEEIDGLKAGDTVTYVIEYRIENYQPGYVILNAYSDLEGAAKPTDSVIQLRKNVGAANLPQITRQTLQQYDTKGNPTSYTRDVTDYTEDVGISTHFNKAELITDVALTDATVTQDTETNYATCNGDSIPSFALYTSEGKELTGQAGGNATEAVQILKLEDLTKNTAPYVFPFSSTAMARSIYTMTDADMKKDGITDEGSNANYSARVKMHFVKDALTIKEETLPFGVSNLSHQEDLAQDEGSAEELGVQVKKDIRNTVDIGSIFKQINVNDMIRKGFVFLQGLSGAAGDNMMNMMILPTEDPATFRIMVFIGYNKKEDREGNAGKNLSINYDADALYDDAQNFEKALEDMTKDDDDDDDSSGEGSLDFNFYGTLMLDARLGISDGNWNIRFVGGNVGTNVEGKYEWSQNFMCGPVPALISFEVGFTADLEVEFADKNGTKAMLLDAALGVSLEAFAGLGFDLSLVAFKLGIFGQIGADVDFMYLTPTNSTGTKLDIDGEIGLRMEVKVLFVKYNKTFCSTGFGWTKKWNKYDAIQQAWETGDFAELTGLTSGGRKYSMFLAANGTALVEIDGEGEIDDRDYLELADRAWNNGAPSGGARLLKAAGPLNFAINSVDNVQTNAYPYANPAFTDDGSMFLYISDNDNARELQSVVSYAVKSGNGYDNKGALDDITTDSNNDGTPDYIFADSDVVASGAGNSVFAAWVKQLESPEKEMKDKATYDDLGMMMNATEIYAGKYNGNTWTTEPLTNNTVADMAPTIASSGDKAIVAWRSLAATELPKDGTEQDITASFNAENNINYRIYDGSEWKQAQIAYNGAAGTVNAIDSAMLSDGTALLTYTVRTDEDVTSTETFYTLIGSDGNVVTTGRLTNNATTDTNAQVTAVQGISGAAGQFVVGWYSEYATGEKTEIPDTTSTSTSKEEVLAHDIGLAMINANGSVDVDFPESIGGEAGSGISSDFHFSAPAGNTDIAKLSVVWSEKNEEDKYELNAVRFYTDGANIGVTTPTDIAKTNARCTVDRFDAYTDGSGIVHTLILSSDYSNMDGLSVYDTIDLSDQGLTVLNGDNDAEPSDDMLTVLEQDPVVNIMLGSGTFSQNDIEVEAQTDLTELTTGLNLPVQFAVKDVGTNTVDEVTVSLGGTNKTFSGLSLLPGQSAALVMEYSVPETVADVNYIVTPKDGSAKTGTLILNRPDIGISGMKILNEIDKKRDIQVTLHNRSGIPLTGSGKIVKLAFYKDSAHMHQIGEDITIDSGNYADIDDGFYTYTQSINVTDMTDEPEIPNEGVSVYARAWVEEAELVDGKAVAVDELYHNDNESLISFRGLLTKYEEKMTRDGMIIPGETEGTYTIKADVRNNSLRAVDLTKITADIYDEADNILKEDVELKDSDVTLQGEEKRSFVSESITDLAGIPARVEISVTELGRPDKPKATKILAKLINYETGKFKTSTQEERDEIAKYEFYAGKDVPVSASESEMYTNANITDVADYDLLTNIVDKTDGTALYARAKVRSTVSDWIKLPLPGRQSTDGIGADYYTDRLVGVRDGVWFTTNGTDPTASQKWSNSNSTDLTKAPVSWDGTVEKTLKFLIPGDNDKQLFPSTVKTVTLGAKGDAPTAGDLEGYPIADTDISFRTAKLPTLKTEDGATEQTKALQYRYKRNSDSDNEWSTWGSVNSLTGLDIATTYKLEIRYAPETDSDGKLVPASQTFDAGSFTTKTTAPDINDVLDRWIDYSNMKFQGTGGVLEYSTEKNATSGTPISDGSSVPTEGFYIRYRAGNDSDGGWTYVNPEVPAAVSGVTSSPEPVKGLGGSLSGTSTSMEYRYKANGSSDWTEWTACKGSSMTKLPAGTYQIRNKKSGSNSPSFAQQLTITAGDPATVTVTVKDSSKNVLVDKTQEGDKAAVDTVKAIPVNGTALGGVWNETGQAWKIDNLTAGTYTIIVTGIDGKQVTSLVDIVSTEHSVDVTLPTGMENSSRLVNSTGWNLAVGGIDDQARALDKAAATKNDEYLISFKAEGLNALASINETELDNATDAVKNAVTAINEIKEATEQDSTYKDHNVQSDYLELSLEKTLLTAGETSVNPIENEKITKASRVMEIIVPYPQIDSRFGIQVRRYHDDKVKKFDVLNTRPASTASYKDGTYVIDRLLKRLYIYSDSFSVYSISYTEDSTVPDPVESSSSGGSSGGGGSTTYKVTFEMNGHGTQIAQQTVIKNAKATKPEDPKAEGFIFDGWFTDSDCTNAYDFSTPVTKAITLYAKWNEVPEGSHTVIFDLNGKEGTAPDIQTIVKDGKAVSPEDPTVEGFIFEGWYTDPECTVAYDFTETVTESITLYAKWVEAKTFTVTFHTDHGTVPEQKTVKNGAAVTEPEPLTEDGWIFSGWFNDVELTNKYDFEAPVKANLDLYAKWKEIPADSYTVSFDLNGKPGTAPDVQVVNKDGKAVRPDDPTAAGFSFKGWFLDAKCTKLYDFDTPVTGNTTLYAGWEELENEDFGICFAEPAASPYEGVWYNSESGRYETAYTGQAIKPLITAISGTYDILKEGVDYTVKYSNNTNASTAKKGPAVITITGKGTFTGKKTIEFYIIPADLGDLKEEGRMVVSDEYAVQSGKKFAPVMVYGSYQLKAKDYELSTTGKITAETTVSITGKGNFTGTIEGITVKALSAAEIKAKTIKVAVKSGKKSYTGEPQELTVTTAEKPGELTVTAGKSKTPLVEDTDFTVSYSGNINAGTARVVVKGIGNYNETVTKTFKINPDKTSEITADLTDPEETVYYTAKGAMPGVTVKVSRKDENGNVIDTVELTPGRDYRITYSGNKKVGDAAYTVKFLGNYKGHKDVKGTFKIVKAPIEEAVVVSPQKVYTKPGKYLSAPFVSIGGVQLKASEYTVKYYEGEVSDVTAVDVKELTSKDKISIDGTDTSKTITVVVTAKDINYTGTATGTYEIVKPATGTIDISKAKIVAKAKSTKGKDVMVGKQEYNGMPVEPEIRVLVKSGKTWTEVDSNLYDVTYVNNVNKGKATILVSGNGDTCIGSRTARFTITSMRMSLFKLIFGE